MSRRLAARSIDHVVLERGEVAHSWRTQRWDSLRLLTPNWMTRLPGFAYRGDDPDGYLDRTRGGPASRGLRRASAAPVLTGTTVTSVRPGGAATWCGPTRAPGTRRRSWWRPARPRCRRPGAAACPPEITTVTRADYRNPGQLPPTAACWSSAPRRAGSRSPTSCTASGRPVTLAVGEHVRMPRTYRGRDILWWMDASGLLDERYERVRTWSGRATCRRCSWSARPRATLDLNALRRLGVRLVGRLAGVRDGSRSSPVPGQRVRAGRPQAGPAAGHARRLGRPSRDRRRGAAAVRADRAPGTARLSTRLGAGGIETIVWATGFRPDLSLLDAGCSTARAGSCTTAGHRRPGPVPDRPAVPAPPQVDPDRRRRGGRPRPGRAPRRPPGRARPTAGRAERNLMNTIPSPPRSPRPSPGATAAAVGSC